MISKKRVFLARQRHTAHRLRGDAGARSAGVVDLTNPDGAIMGTKRGTCRRRRAVVDRKTGAIRAMPRVIPPGQRGRVALVFNRSVIEDKAMVEILRDSRPELAVEVSSQELDQRNSPWP